MPLETTFLLTTVDQSIFSTLRVLWFSYSAHIWNPFSATQLTSSLYHCCIILDFYLMDTTQPIPPSVHTEKLHKIENAPVLLLNTGLILSMAWSLPRAVQPRWANYPAGYEAAQFLLQSSKSKTLKHPKMRSRKWYTCAEPPWLHRGSSCLLIVGT